MTLPPPVVHPAYEFHFSVSNFVKLDSGPTGKSGILGSILASVNIFSILSLWYMAVVVLFTKVK